MPSYIFGGSNNLYVANSKYPRVSSISFRRVVDTGPDTTPPAFFSSEEGDVNNFVVAVTITEPIEEPTSDFLSGVTIKKNGITVSLDSGVLQGDLQTIYYTITTNSEADADDLITWEYSDTLGGIRDLYLNQLGDVSAQSIVNNVGEHLRFDHAVNSMQLVTAGIL